MGFGSLNTLYTCIHLHTQVSDLFCNFSDSEWTDKVKESGPEVIKKISCSTQLSMKFYLLITVKMLTIVGILTFMSGKNSILCLSGPKKSRIS